MAAANRLRKDGGQYALVAACAAGGQVRQSSVLTTSHLKNILFETFMKQTLNLHSIELGAL